VLLAQMSWAQSCCGKWDLNHGKEGKGATAREVLSDRARGPRGKKGGEARLEGRGSCLLRTKAGNTFGPFTGLEFRCSLLTGFAGQVAGRPRRGGGGRKRRGRWEDGGERPTTNQGKSLAPSPLQGYGLS
jgi:hypothetical protein